MLKFLRQIISDPKKQKYLLVGLWNTIAAYTLFAGLYFYLQNYLNYLIILSISQICGLTNAYFSYKFFVFKTKGNFIKEYIRFCLVYGTTFVANLILISIFVGFLGLNIYFCQAIISIFVVVLAYLGHEYFSFSPSFSLFEINLSNKKRTILITGASSGIGEALAYAYADKNINLILISRTRSLLNKVSKECQKKGAHVFDFVADVSNIEKMQKIITIILKKLGHIDIVIANAGIRIEEDYDYKNLQVLERTMQVNFLGVAYTLAPFVPFMIKNKAGQLVAISSIGSLRGTPNSGAYSASKAAVDLWTESLRLRMKEHKVQVTTINLGFVKTAMTEGLPFWMPGILTPDKAAALIKTAINKKKRTVIIPWQSNVIWGIFQLLPGVLYDNIILFAKNIQKEN
jgi:short-subunit dehydrogenase/putative flippase GtrA